MEALQGDRDAPQGSSLWTAIPGRRWGSGMWLNEGTLDSTARAEAYTGRVIAALVEGRRGPRASGVDRWWPLVFSCPRAQRQYLHKGSGIHPGLREGIGGRASLDSGRRFQRGGGAAPRRTQPDGYTRRTRDPPATLRDEFDLIPCWQTVHPGEPLARTLRWIAGTTPCPTTAMEYSCLLRGPRPFSPVRCWRTAIGAPSATITLSWRRSVSHSQT